MIFYKDNPNLKLKVVKTINDELEYKINCKKIKSDYCVIDQDCHTIDGVTYRVKSGLIIFDHSKKEWVVKAKAGKLINGIIDFTPDPQFGLFSHDPYNNCRYEDSSGHIYTVLNPDILIQNGKGENFSTGIWHDLKKVDVRKLQKPANILDHTNKGYNIEDNAEEFATKQLLYKAYNTPLGKEVQAFGNMLGNTTFGVEIECAKGNLPEFIQNRTGIVICRDGSLKDENGKPGPEFVTIPLQGAKGIQTLNTIAKELGKRTTLDLNCSLHIHFGTIGTTRTNLVALYKVASRIQNEIFTMFPFYKTNPEGIKNKNYNKKLPGLGILKQVPSTNKEEYHNYINDSYKQIFTWLAEGYTPDKERNRINKKHPSHDKWNRHERYYWLNFMNTIFSNRNTVEFRLHGPTTNNQKIINWLFICNAIIKYAENNTNRILLTNCAISLNDILSYYNRYGSKGKFLTEYLQAYVQSRKDAFLEDYQNGDRVSEWDYKNDSGYKFTYNNITNLF